MEILNVGNRVINHYLYAIKGGYVLIDTGYEGSYKRFKEQLALKNREVNEIKYIFLTHAHDDHAGFLNEILEENDQIKVILSEQALEGLLRGQNAFDGGCTSILALIFCKLMALVGKGSHSFPPLKEELRERCLFVNSRTQKDLEQLLEGRIYTTPGHTKCSIALRLGRKVLFIGDAAMNGLPSRHKITIWAEDKESFYKTWKKIIGLKVEMLYPAHGKPFSTKQLVDELPRLRGIKLFALKNPIKAEKID